MKRKTPLFETEAQLAAEVVAWLNKNHWDVYQEVRPSKWGGSVADIVAVQGKIVRIIECKLTFGIDVVDQCRNWSHRAHFVHAAVPDGRFGRHNDTIDWLVRHFGIGVLQVGPQDYEAGDGVREIREGKFYRVREECSIRGCLCEEQKSSVAGTNQGGYWTPFKDTLRSVERAAIGNPGCTIGEIVAKIKHHYGSDSTARACLRPWLETGKIPSLELRREGKALRVYPKGFKAERNSETRDGAA